MCGEENASMKIAYICDRKKCKNCSDICNHTTDINHAVNFKEEAADVWMELEEAGDESTIEEKPELD